ncbi:hypothetical protein BJ741DRAFT_585183 [Chytriomyces cf. hyalinus JEL632]|nr:hypothetical protein BJ741DRAFT_585183 [Chytriomyces cf. hyalinus JEL632]
MSQQNSAEIKDHLQAPLEGPAFPQLLTDICETLKAKRGVVANGVGLSDVTRSPSVQIRILEVLELLEVIPAAGLYAEEILESTGIAGDTSSPAPTPMVVNWEHDNDSVQIRILEVLELLELIPAAGLRPEAPKLTEMQGMGS